MTESAGTPDSRRSRWVGALLGIGVMAAVDQIVFHQLLGWHHFYDRATPDIALLSDGILHAAELIMLVAGTFLVADLSRRRSLSRAAFGSGVLLGAGAFQVFDGLVDHKVLRVHQVRYGVDLLPYDVAWNVMGVLLLLVGVAWARHARREEQAS